MIPVSEFRSYLSSKLFSNDELVDFLILFIKKEGILVEKADMLYMDVNSFIPDVVDNIINTDLYPYPLPVLYDDYTIAGMANDEDFDDYKEGVSVLLEFFERFFGYDTGADNSRICLKLDDLRQQYELHRAAFGIEPGFDERFEQELRSQIVGRTTYEAVIEKMKHFERFD